MIYKIEQNEIEKESDSQSDNSSSIPIVFTAANHNDLNSHSPKSEYHLNQSIQSYQERSFNDTILHSLNNSQNQEKHSSDNTN